MARTTTTTTTTRRTALKYSGLALTGGLGAGALLSASSEPAEATVVANDISVPDQSEYESEDGSVHSPWLIVNGSWSYVVERTPDRWQLSLTVGRDGENFQPIDTLSGSAIGTSMTKTYELAGAVIDHPDWASSDFDAPGDGESVSHDVPLRVELEIRAGDGSTMIAAQDGGVVTLTVTDTGTTAEAFVAGDVSVGWQRVEGSAPPV